MKQKIRRNQLLCYNYTTTHKAIFINVQYNYKQLDKKLKGLVVWRQLLFVTPFENYWID